MRHTPVSASPARIARSTGAAPRQRGSSEKWRLTIGTASSTCGLIELAEGDDHAELDPRVDARRRPWSVTGRPSSSAAAFTGLGDRRAAPRRGACRRG